MGQIMGGANYGRGNMGHIEGGVTLDTLREGQHGVTIYSVDIIKWHPVEMKHREIHCLIST